MKAVFTSIGIMLIAACTPPTHQVGKTIVASDNGIEIPGKYGYGPGAATGKTGTITIFPNNDSTLLFGIDLSVGPPSYNMGVLFDTLRIDVSGHDAHFESNSYGEKGCKWHLVFHGDSLTIKTLDGAYQCGFGNGVFADGTYRLLDRALPNAYTNQVGDTIYRVNH